MPDAITNLTQGMPVEIGKIDRELKRLWQEGEGAATRASLINFAVYCEGAESMRETNDIIFQITRDHACRAILIGLDPATPGAAVQATISAHCHLGRAGGKHVCCEQISFMLGCDGQPLIPNIVFSHLDSDLPLVLWWRGDLPSAGEEHLWTWVDRLIFDSQTWSHAADEFELLRIAIEPFSHRMTLCDLNWTRSLYLRQAVAQIFDQPEYLAELPALDTAEITHAPGMRSTALLMTGWLASQLQWQYLSASGSDLKFKCIGGNTVTVTLTEQPGRALGSIRLSTGSDTSFLVAHRDASDFLYADIHLSGNRESHSLMPGGKDDLVALLNEELMSGGKHKVYLKAASVIAGAL
jgi:glucose-6-phosphate dehydrogenase assembly protein OpcA